MVASASKATCWTYGTTGPRSHHMKIIEIEGIGEVYAGKLEEAGIKTVEDLLAQGATRQGRESLAEKTGISGPLLLRWVNHADLTRIVGVAEQYAELLEAAGVDSVPELATRVAANLHAKMAEVNEAKRLVRRLPSVDQVSQWIEQCKSLPRAVFH
jgi:predicted flap endonuclease-1-like 5' DNA nuclease